MSEPCGHCGGNKDMRNPTGRCDHLYYPKFCDTCMEQAGYLMCCKTRPAGCQVHNEAGMLRKALERIQAIPKTPRNETAMAYIVIMTETDIQIVQAALTATKPKKEAP